MKITIELSEAEAKGIKDYHLQEFGEKVSKNDIKLYIQGIVSGTINAETVKLIEMVIISGMM